MSTEGKKSGFARIVGKIELGLGKAFGNEKMMNSGLEKLSTAQSATADSHAAIQSAALDPPLPESVVAPVLNVDPKKDLHAVGDVPEHLNLSPQQQTSLGAALQASSARDKPPLPLGEYEPTQKKSAEEIAALQGTTDEQAAVTQATEQSLHDNPPQPQQVILATDQGLQGFATGLIQVLPAAQDVTAVPVEPVPAKDMHFAPGFGADISPIKASDVRQV